MQNLKHPNSYSFKLEISKSNSGATSFGGLPLLHKALKEIGLIDHMKQVFYLKGYIKAGGYQDHVILEAIILLMAAGGTCFSDWEYLASDPGFQKMFGACMSVDTIERYLKRLVVTEITHEGAQGLVGYSTLLEIIHKEMMTKAYELAGRPNKLTLDLDTSIFTTGKSDALFSYEMTKAYQPFVAYCPELKMVIAHEFRDGNISPQTGYKRVIQRCVSLFPDANWTVRSDSAGYNVALMDWMESKRITYYVTADQFEPMREILLKHKAWQAYVSGGITTEQECAEIAYVATFSSQEELKLRSRFMRFIAVRKLKTGQLEIGADKYVYQVIATNSKERDLNLILKTHWKRCGSVEYAHSQLKSGCGLKKFPSGDFGVNAAWFSLAVLTHNVLRLLQEHVLPEELKNCEIETLRFRFIRVAAWIKHKARQTVLRCCKGHPLYEMYRKALAKLDELAYRLQVT
jgi:hypothetical protein